MATSVSTTSPICPRMMDEHTFYVNFNYPSYDDHVESRMGDTARARYK